MLRYWSQNSASRAIFAFSGKTRAVTSRNSSGGRYVSCWPPPNSTGSTYLGLTMRRMSLPRLQSRRKIQLATLAMKRLSRVVGQTGENGLMFVQRRARQPLRDAARVIERAMALHQRAQPRDFVGAALGARARQMREQATSLLGLGCARDVDQHQRALALVEIAVDLLAIGLVGFEVENVVLDLERRAEEEAEADQRVEIGRPARGDHRAHAQGMDRRQPAGLLHHHGQIIGLADVLHVVAPPAELQRLTLDRLPRHALGLAEHGLREPGPKRVEIVDERPDARQRQRVADD